MATRNTRDVKMTLSVETLGADEIKKLQTSVAQLAQEGGDAAPEFQRLADEIGRLGQQTEAIRLFQQLSDATDQLSQRQLEAATRADQLQVKLTDAAAATRAAAQTQQQADAAYQSSSAALRDITGELTILRNTYDENGKRAANFKDEVLRLTQAKVQQKAAVDNDRQALTQANTALREAERAQAKLETAVSRTSRALETANSRLTQGQAALNAQRQATEAIGVSTEDLARAQTELVQALNRTGQAAGALKTNLDQARAAEKALADEARRASDAYAEQVQSINAEIRLRQRAATERAAAAQRVAAAERAAADAAAAAKRQEQEESDRLANIIIANRERMELAGKVALAAELAAQREAAELSVRIEREKTAAIETEARKSAEAVSNAFERVGVRGAAALQQEIAEVRAAMQLLSTQADLTGAEIAGAMRAGNAQIAALERELRGLTGQLTLADRAADAFRNSLGQIAIGNLVADGIGALVERLKEMGRQFIQVNLQADTARRALNALYGESEITTQQMDFLRRAAQAAGVSIGAISADFVKFSAATKASNIPLEDTNAVFAAVTRAAGSLGLSADKTGLALNALGQIASKSVVSMEELRQQLGDSIPGALSLTAKGLGITDAELIKLVETGQLLARDFFPAFTKGLKELEGDTNSLTNTWQRFKNVLTISAQAAGEAGALELLSVAVKGLGVVLGTVVVAVSTFVEGLKSAGAVLTFFYEAVRNNPTDAWDTLIDRLEGTNDRLRRQTDAISGLISPNTELQAATGRTAAVNRELALTASDAAREIEAMTPQIQAAAAAAGETALGQQALAAATRASATAASGAGAAWVRLNTEIAALTETAEKQIVVAGKERAAAEIQATTVERLARLRGDERGQLEAAVQASEINVNALQNEAVKRQQLVNVLQVQLAEQIKIATQQDGNILQRQQEIIAIQERLNLATVESQRAQQAVAEAQAEATARGLVRQTYEDNAAAVDQLRLVMEQANVAAATAAELERQGIASKAEVTAANETAAVATALYNDALDDQREIQQALNNLEATNFDLREINIKAMIAQTQAEIDIAQAKGETYKITQLQNDLKRLEIELIGVGIEAKRAEADAIIAAAEADRARLIASGEMTRAQELAIEAAIRKAQVLQREADIADITRQRLVELERINRLAGNTAQNSAGQFNGLSGSLDRVAGNADRAAGAIQRLNRLRGGGGGGGGDGEDEDAPPPGAGTRQSGTASLTPLQQLLLKERAGTLSASDAGLARAAIEQQQLAVDTVAALGGSSTNLGGARGALNNARRLFELTQTAGNQRQATPTTARPSGGGAGSSLTINLGGQSTRINTATPQDAQALASVLRQLESSQQRTF